MATEGKGLKTLEKIEGFGREAGAVKDFKVFRYAAPTDIKRSRVVAPLARSDILFSMVQVFRGTGGEPEMHSHAAMDGFWFVLKGRARFYGDKDGKDVLVADLGQHEGIFVPREVKYWFEIGDCEQLELLQVESIDPRVPNTYTRYSEKKPPNAVDIYTPDGSLIAADVTSES